jgi:CRISPR/Cas system CSM-associated protein Csm4 (group 5 of RAMP superfamily)
VVAWDAGAYQTLLRSGFTPAGAEKPAQRYVREGSVLASDQEPRGRLSEVEVEGAGHPVVRYGAGLALPWQEGV